MASENLKIQISAIDRTQAAFSSIQKNLGTLKGQIATVFAGAAILAFGKNALETADNVAKAAKRVGVSGEFFQQYRFAAEQSGISNEEFSKTLDVLTRKIGEAQRGLPASIESFRTLGVSLYDSNGIAKSTEQIFKEVNTALADSKNATIGASAANELYGKSGIKVFGAVTGNIEAFNKLAETAPGVISDETLSRAERFNDALNKLNKTAVAPLQEGFILLADSLTPIVDDLGVVIKDMTEFAKKEPEIVKLALAIGGLGLAAALFGKKVALITAGVAAAVAGYVKLKEAITGVDSKLAEVVVTADRLPPVMQKIEDDGLRLITFTEAWKQKLDDLDLKDWEDKIRSSGKSLRDYAADAQDVNKALEMTALNGLKSMEDALLNVMMGTMSVKDAFKAMTLSILSDLAKILIRKSITGPLADVIGGFFGAPGASAGARAIGGQVQAGQPYMVGERGPEMFVPNQSGSIVSNKNMTAASSGATNVVVNVNMDNGTTNATDANKLGILIGNVVKGELVKQKRPGGLLAA